MSDPLDTADIARLLEITREHCTDRVTKRPDFPAPAVNLSRRLRRWRMRSGPDWPASRQTVGGSARSWRRRRTLSCGMACCSESWRWPAGWRKAKPLPVPEDPDLTVQEGCYAALRLQCQTAALGNGGAWLYGPRKAEWERASRHGISWEIRWRD